MDHACVCVTIPVSKGLTNEVQHSTCVSCLSSVASWSVSQNSSNLKSLLEPSLNKSSTNPQRFGGHPLLNHQHVGGTK